MTSRRVVQAAVALIITIAAQPLFAQHASVIINGVTQGLIQGDETNKSFGANTIAILGVTHSLTMPFDATTGLPPDRPRVEHRPIEIVKLPDKSTPKLLRALVTNESLNVEIRFYRTVTSGAVVLYHTFKLSGAGIKSIRSTGDTNAPNGVTETVAFTYSTLEVIDNVNGGTVVDTWN
jgi:type VI secretion system Hcp family effector